MSELTEMLKRTNMDNLLSYLIYDKTNDAMFVENYSEAIDKSLDAFFTALEEIHPSLNRENDKLFSVVSDFVIAHDDIYFSAGVLVGFQLYKNLDKEYDTHKSEDIKALLEKASISK